jgi:hypothetical protein
MSIILSCIQPMWFDIGTTASGSMGWALRDQSYSVVICSEEFNIPADYGGCSSSTVAVAAVLLS